MTIMKRGDSNRPRVLDTITSALCARAIISMPARGRHKVSNMLSPTRWKSAPYVSCTLPARSSQYPMSRSARHRCIAINMLRAARCTSATIYAHITPALGRPIFASMTARRQCIASTTPKMTWSASAGGASSPTPARCGGFFHTEGSKTSTFCKQNGNEDMVTVRK